MKITINIDEKFPDTEIVINSGNLTPEIERIIATLRMMDSQIMVTKGDEAYILDVSKIVYAESVDRHTFVYTEQECYESKLKLYEMEEKISFPSLVKQLKPMIKNFCTRYGIRTRDFKNENLAS